MADLAQLLNDYKGYTYKQKIINDCNKILLENKSKVLGYLPRPSEISLVSVTSEKNKGEILSIGGSKPFDLITDNFGKLINRGHGTLNLSLALTNIGGGSSTFKGTSTSFDMYQNNVTIAGGSGIAVGDSSTPPTRSDFDITNRFVNFPESGQTSTGVGGYNAGLGQISASSVIGATGGAGTVRETTFIGFYITTANTQASVTLAHDIVTDAIFALGQFINVTYTWQI